MGMETEGLAELVGHYLLLLILVFAALTLVSSIVDDASLWLELLIVLVIAFSYRPIVLRLGVAPERWERQHRE